MAGSLKEAIEALLIKREKVYREDPDRLLQDARGAQRAARDYRGRWLWELLQNCEDAHATRVLFCVMDGPIYLADNGDGFNPLPWPTSAALIFRINREAPSGAKGWASKRFSKLPATPRYFLKIRRGWSSARTRPNNGFPIRVLSLKRFLFNGFPFSLTARRRRVQTLF